MLNDEASIFSGSEENRDNVVFVNLLLTMVMFLSTTQRAVEKRPLWIANHTGTLHQAIAYITLQQHGSSSATQSEHETDHLIPLGDPLGLHPIHKTRTLPSSSALIPTLP